MQPYTQDYLLDKQVKIFQPIDGYRASTDAVMVSSLVHQIKKGDKILDVGSGTGAISLSCFTFSGSMSSNNRT